MEILTGEEIRQLSSVSNIASTWNKKKKWVAVDDMIKWVEDCDDGTAFNEYQIRKRTIIKALNARKQSKKY